MTQELAYWMYFWIVIQAEIETMELAIPEAAVFFGTWNH